MEKEKIFENLHAAADEKRVDSAFLRGYFDLTFLPWSYNIEESILKAGGGRREEKALTNCLRYTKILWSFVPLG